MLNSYQPVDYSKMVEDEDGTTAIMEAACSGGACELVHSSGGTNASGLLMVFEGQCKECDGKYELIGEVQETPLGMYYYAKRI